MKLAIVTLRSIKLIKILPDQEKKKENFKYQG